MSLARWPGLRPRQELSLDSVNGFADTFESITSVSPVNLAEEGLDLYGLATGIVGVRVAELYENTAYTLTTHTGASGWTTWDPSGANAFTQNVALNNANDALLLQAEVQFKSTAGGAFGIAANSTTRFRFAWTDTGGAHNSSSPTGIGQGYYSGTGGNGARVRPHGSVRTFYLLKGSQITGTLSSVRLEYVLARTDGLGAGAVGITPAKSTMLITRLRRVS